MIACINGPSKQQKMMPVPSDAIFVVAEGSPFERFPQPGSAIVKENATKRCVFSSDDMIVNPYDDSMKGDAIFVDICERGCFCFLKWGWYMVVNMFHVEACQR